MALGATTDRLRTLGARAVAFGALASLVVPSCARPPEAISPPPEGAAVTRSRRPMRPSIARSYEVDYFSLPELTAMSDEEAARAAMTSHDAGAAVGALYVQGADRVLLGIPSPAYVPRALLGSPGPCRDRTATAARWEGFSPAGRTGETLPFFRFEGVLASGRCSLASGHAFHAAARAIVPDLLYAYRDLRRLGEERLEIIGPRGAWTGSSEEAERLDHDEQIFSTVSIRVVPGGSASAFVEATAESTCRFAKGRSKRVSAPNDSKDTGDDCAPKEPLRTSAAVDTPDALSFDPERVAAPETDVAYTFGIEIVWPSADRGPSATAYVARVRADEASVAAPPPRSDFIDFVE